MTRRAGLARVWPLHAGFDPIDDAGGRIRNAGRPSESGSGATTELRAPDCTPDLAPRRRAALLDAAGIARRHSAAFGWTDSHLFEFVIGNAVYGEPMPDDDFGDRHVYNAEVIRRKTLIERGIERFLCVYDFDGEADVDYPAFVDGERRCPPEDVGGVPGFMEFLEAALDTPR